MSMWPRDVMNEVEKNKLGQLNINFRRNFSLHLIVLHNDFWRVGLMATKRLEKAM